MNTYLLRDGRRFPCDINDDGSACAVVGHACFVCSASPFFIVGGGKRPSQDDRAVECDAHCRKCLTSVGVCRVEVNTIFGVAQDMEAFSDVVNRGGRVYG